MNTILETQDYIRRIEKRLATLRKLWLLEKKNRPTLALQGRVWKSLLLKYQVKLNNLLYSSNSSKNGGQVSFKEAKRILTSMPKKQV